MACSPLAVSSGPWTLQLCSLSFAKQVSLSPLCVRVCVHVRTSGAISFCNTHTRMSVFCGRANKHNELHYPWGSCCLAVALALRIRHVTQNGRGKAGENSFVAPPNWNNMPGTANMKRKWKRAKWDMKNPWVSRFRIHLFAGYVTKRLQDVVVAESIEFMHIHYSYSRELETPIKLNISYRKKYCAG